MATRQQCVPKSRGTMVLPSAVLSLMSLDTFDPEKPTTWPPDAEHWFQVSYPIEVVDAKGTFSSPHPKATIKFWAVSSTGNPLPIDLCKAFLIGTYIFVRIRFF